MVYEQNALWFYVVFHFESLMDPILEYHIMDFSQISLFHFVKQPSKISSRQKLAKFRRVPSLKWVWRPKS